MVPRSFPPLLPPNASSLLPSTLPVKPFGAYRSPTLVFLISTCRSHFLPGLKTFLTILPLFFHKHRVKHLKRIIPQKIVVQSSNARTRYWARPWMLLEHR